MSEMNLRKLQLVELEILCEFDRVCKKYGIQYFLDSGTALGAVRHGGFIPWDDDIDVGMLRNDYERFINEASKDLDEKFFLQTHESDPDCPCLFAKIRKNGTTYLENNKKNMKMHTGIWIDLFPFDYITENETKQKKFIQKVVTYRNIFQLKKIPHRLKNQGQNPVRYYFFAGIRKISHVFAKLIPDKYLISKIDGIIGENQGEDKCVTCFYYGKPIVFLTEKLIPVRRIIFEGKEFLGVNDSDYYLKRSYGNYMELPPEGKRVGHRPLFVDYGMDE